MQFDVCPNPNPATSKRFPYLLDIQSDVLQSLQTRIVIPLAPQADFAAQTITRLMPVLSVQGKDYVAVVPQMAGVPFRELRSPISNLSDSRTEIIAALDLLITGV